MVWVRMVVACFLSLACLAADRKGGVLVRFPSRLLRREVQLAVHAPSPAVLKAWADRHGPGGFGLVLFLPGAYDGPGDLFSEGIFEDLDRREASGELKPSLWIAVAHFRSWYADRADGTFPYERFLMEELLPALEREHPGFGGIPVRRAVAGLSMGGFGALNLAARTGLFARCAALSPALVDAPFRRAGFLLRPSLRRAFPDSQAAFKPWNPWVHGGGEAELYLGCGRQDKYGLAEATARFAAKAEKPGRKVAFRVRDGGHDWAYWAPEFKRLAPWLAGQAELVP
jgi:hypothetical protein